MISPVFGSHVVLTLVATASFLWVLLELMKPSRRRVKRAKVAALFGVACLLTSWIFGGMYFSTSIGSMASTAQQVQAQALVAVQEYLFLLLLFLAILFTGLLFQFEPLLMEHQQTKGLFLVICCFVVLLGLIIAGLNYHAAAAVAEVAL